MAKRFLKSLAHETHKTREKIFRVIRVFRGQKKNLLKKRSNRFARDAIIKVMSKTIFKNSFAGNRFALENSFGRLPVCELYLEHQMQNKLLSLQSCLLRNSVKSLRARVQS